MLRINSSASSLSSSVFPSRNWFILSQKSLDIFFGSRCTFLFTGVSDCETLRRMKVTDIFIADIKVGQRRRDDYGDIQSLADSIARYNLINPITVDEDNNLVAGERRLRACQLLGWLEIPCRLYSELPPELRLEIELEENLRRKDLTPLEASKNLVQLAQVAAKINQTEFRATTAQKSKGRSKEPDSLHSIADRVGVAPNTIKAAQEHVAAVESYPELETKSQKEAIQTAKTLDKLPEKKREQVRSNLKPVYKAPIPKPDRSSPLRDVQAFIADVKSKGGILNYTGRMTETEQVTFCDQIASCRDELDRFVSDLTDHFDERSAWAS
jgi:ParB family chromosome partitioning protein